MTPGPEETADRALAGASARLAGALVALLVALAAADAAPARAETRIAALSAGAEAMQLRPEARAEVQAALRRMSDTELRLAYARIHATFRQQLGAEDLRIARALIDYAALAEAELAARNLPLPEPAESAAAMRRLYDLIL